MGLWVHYTVEKSHIFFSREINLMHCLTVLTLLTFIFSHLNCVVLWKPCAKTALFPWTKIAQILTCILGFGWYYYSGVRCYSVCRTYFALKAKNICFSSKSTELVSLHCVLPCHPQDKDHDSLHACNERTLYHQKGPWETLQKAFLWSSYTFCLSLDFFALF